jgi:hypothetical protein
VLTADAQRARQLDPQPAQVLIKPVTYQQISDVVARCLTKASNRA